MAHSKLRRAGRKRKLETTQRRRSQGSKEAAETEAGDEDGKTYRGVTYRSDRAVWWALETHFSGRVKNIQDVFSCCVVNIACLF